MTRVFTISIGDAVIVKASPATKADELKRMIPSFI